MSVIKDVNEEQEESKYALFDEISVRFMRAVKHEYGSEAAVDTLNHLQQTLGKAWVARVMFHIMSDNHAAPYSFTLSMDPFYHGTVGKINCIKAVRAITFMGLGEAKAFVERAMDGDPQTAKIDLTHVADDKHKAQYFKENISEMKRAGFKVQTV